MIMTTKRLNYLKSLPLTFTSTADSSDETRPSITVYQNKGFTNMQYCYDYDPNETNTWVNVSSGTAIQLDGHDSISLRAEWINNRTNPNTSGFTNNWTGNKLEYPSDITDDSWIDMTYNVHVSGNINSLLAYDFVNIDSLDSYGSATFRGLFRIFNSNSGISDILLPNKTLSPYCYAYMFWGIKRINSEIPNELLPKGAKLAKGCCEGMFYDYIGLRHGDSKPLKTDACLIRRNALPPTELAEDCYKLMFASPGHFRPYYNLEPGFRLPAQTMYPGCYGGMFSGVIFPIDMILPKGMLPAKTLATNCYRDMFYKATWANPEIEDISGCSRMPKEDTQTPTFNLNLLLPAEYLNENAYYEMFYCSNITAKPDARYKEWENNATYNWIYQTKISSSSLSKVIWNKVINLTDRYYNRAYADTEVSQKDAVFPIFTGTGNPFTGTFAGCSNVTNWPDLPVNATSQTQDYNSLYYGYTQCQKAYTGTLDKVSLCEDMFNNSGITSANITISNSNIGKLLCSGMFRNCPNLTTATITFDSSCTFLEASSVFSNMFYNCDALTTVTIKGLPNMSTWDYSENKLYSYFSYMFYGCDNLSRVNLDLPAFISDYTVGQQISLNMFPSNVNVDLYLPGTQGDYMNLYSSSYVTRHYKSVIN